VLLTDKEFDDYGESEDSFMSLCVSTSEDDVGLFDICESVSHVIKQYIQCRLHQLPDLVDSVNTGPGRGPGPLRSNIASFRSWNIFWTGLGPCVAFALLFLFISHKQFM